MRPRAHALVLTSLALMTAAAAGAVPIRDLHQETSTGTPANPYPVGTTVTVTGVVSCPDSILSKVNTEVFVQDTTGGISAFRTSGIAAGFHYHLGDSVTVTGQIAQFNGLTEIGNA